MLTVDDSSEPEFDAPSPSSRRLYNLSPSPLFHTLPPLAEKSPFPSTIHLPMESSCDSNSSPPPSSSTPSPSSSSSLSYPLSSRPPTPEYPPGFSPKRSELPHWYDDGGKSWSYSDPRCFTPSPRTSGEENLKSLLLGVTISSSSFDEKCSWWDANEGFPNGVFLTDRRQILEQCQ
ncbi:hypothetical protein PVAP13_7NG051900 [Panicum virgatum]|uniref:Uncharacterized protein n=1 Tax=Panicum virgatum TaxID=38727 RepID=A0A8T0PSR9_PANVG|nr:hypothetical protein PVAP13_7NG051900 [Panicum virgatum]